MSCGFDKTNVHNDIGIDLDVNTASLGTSSAIGLDMDIVGATTGTHTSIGLDINVSASDANNGIIINTPDGATGTGLKVVSSADTADYFTVDVGTHGETTLATVDDGAAIAHLNLDVDGNITLDADAGTITFSDGGSSLGTVTSAGWSGAVAASTLTSTGVTTIGNNSATVAINSSDWDISTTGAISNCAIECGTF